MTERLSKTSENGIFAFVGIETLEHLFFGAVPAVDDAARKEMLESVKEKLNSLF
jgi:NAD(P)H dehydrogenase (quinone)